MKLKFYITIFLTVVFFTANAQSNYYYYYKGEKVFMNLDKTTINISVFNQFQKSSLNNLQLKEYDLENDNSQNTTSNLKYAKVEFKSIPSDIEYFQKLNTIKNTSNIRTVYPSFIGLDGTNIGLSDYLYVKLKTSSDLSLLQQKANQYKLNIIEQNQFMPLWYTLRCTENTTQTSLEVANMLFETSLFASSVPDLLTYDDAHCANDTFFYDSWGLSNTGQNGGTSGLDIKACDAWNITQGQNIVVAVLDHGLELNHPDLSNNIHPLSYDSESNSSPSLVLGRHGVACAGIIGAVKDNNEGVVGVSPDAELMSISNSLQGTANSRIKRADGINWAILNGADIISNSWGSGVQYDPIDDAIDNAITNGRGGLGAIIVFSTGNGNGNVAYPANSNDGIIAVGAMTPCGERKSPTSCDGETNWGSNFGNELDVVAPGVLIPTTDRQGANGYNPAYENDPNYSNFNNYYSRFNGTSSAAPHVAGVAALILSANPCLSGQQVRDIIEQTAQKVGSYSYTSNSTHPNGTWNNEMGYGLIDAYAAVQMAQSMGSPTLDLYVKNSPDDEGTEPNSVTQHMWTSQDIWIRNSNDGGLTHQNPEYNAPVPIGIGSNTYTPPNYIYVRVINKSCVASTGNETLTLNWAKANTALAWPQNWDGSLQNSGGFDLGGEFNPVTIPSLQGGEEAIISIPWPVPNPDDYTTGQGSDNPWHFCIMARIDSPDDPMGTFTSNPNVMVRNNNNQAWKNITVVDLESDATSASVMVANPSDTPRTFFLELQKQDNEGGKAIFEEAEVTLKMDDILLEAWERGGRIAEKLDPTIEEKRKLVKGDNVILDDIAFEANEMGLLTLDFNFLTEELTDKSEYTYHVVQKDANTGEVIGGETYVIRKDTRPIFIADAGGDKEVDLNETISINAEDINEPAIYNWYDEDGNLIYQGKDLTVTADVVKEYKLEVIANTDGFKDYTDVKVKFKPNTIESLSPNPVSNNLTVNYKINDASSSYLMVMGYYGSNTSNNYILDNSLQQTQINVSSYPSGYYTIALVCNGEIVDAKTLIKQ
jgi:subtilisin family serine protease